MAKRLRVCPDCEATFENGNKLKQHRRSRHPKTKAQRAADRKTLSQYRTAVILAQLKGTT